MDFFLQTLAFLVTGFFMTALVVLCYYLIKFLRNLTDLTEIRMEKEKKETELLKEQIKKAQS